MSPEQLEAKAAERAAELRDAIVTLTALDDPTNDWDGIVYEEAQLQRDVLLAIARHAPPSPWQRMAAHATSTLTLPVPRLQELA